ATEAQSFGLLNPQLCYLLDGILFIYGIIVTALYLRAKFSGSAGADANQQGSNQIYNVSFHSADLPAQSYPRTQGSSKTSSTQARRKPQEGVYNALQKNQMADAYSEIQMKQKRQKDKGHNDLYQGLSAATKDTYDALHMQTLPPR
ncbi:T-cell surface glycoprotein CD3 zeta chain, partial [Lemmus lemmus]